MKITWRGCKQSACPQDTWIFFWPCPIWRHKGSPVTLSIVFQWGSLELKCGLVAQNTSQTNTQQFFGVIIYPAQWEEPQGHTLTPTSSRHLVPTCLQTWWQRTAKQTYALASKIHGSDLVSTRIFNIHLTCTFWITTSLLRHSSTARLKAFSGAVWEKT